MGTLTLRGALVLTLDSRDQVFDPGYLVVQDRRIAEVGPGAGPRGDVTLDLTGRLAMPGLINAHTHTPMVLYRGLAEGRSLLTLDGWYDAIRTWEQVLDPDFVPPAVTVSCAEMIRTGTTCFADHYFFMDRIVPAVRQSGLRAALAYGIVEMGDEAARRSALGEAEAFLESPAATSGSQVGSGRTLFSWTTARRRSRWNSSWPTATAPACTSTSRRAAKKTGTASIVTGRLPCNR